MRSYRETLAAGVPLAQHLGGRVFYIQRCDAGAVLTVELVSGTEVQRVDNVGKGLKAAPVGGFLAYKITASVACVVDFVIADGDIDVQFDSETKISNDNTSAVPVRTVAGQPLEVLFAGTVAPVLGSVTVTNSNAAAVPVQQQALAVLVAYAPAVINTGAAQGLVSDATLKRLRIRNASATARIALGAASTTMANAAIILEPGDIWVEDDAAGAAWYATSDTAGADVRIMGLK